MIDADASIEPKSRLEEHLVTRECLMFSILGAGYSEREGKPLAGPTSRSHYRLATIGA